MKSDGSEYKALKDISLTIKKGEVVSVVGESGSGKSTLARLLIGIEPVSSGSIYINGKDTSKWSYNKWRKNRSFIQAVFQDASGTLNPRKSPYKNIEIGLKHLTDLSSEERRNRIYDIMSMLQMDQSILKTPVNKLSGGEQRRLSLIRCLAIQPDFIILDEVTGGLDMINADKVMTLLESYRSEYGCGCIFITHDMRQAYRISDRILVLEGGQIQQIGSRKGRAQDEIEKCS